jgi:chromosome segregation ATPase
LKIEEGLANVENTFSLITNLWNHFEKEKNKLIEETRKIRQAFNFIRQQLEDKTKQCQQLELEKGNLLKQIEEKTEQLEKEKKRLYEV